MFNLELYKKHDAIEGNAEFAELCTKMSIVLICVIGVLARVHVHLYLPCGTTRTHTMQSHRVHHCT